MLSKFFGSADFSEALPLVFFMGAFSFSCVGLLIHRVYSEPYQANPDYINPEWAAMFLEEQAEARDANTARWGRRLRLG